MYCVCSRDSGAIYHKIFLTSSSSGSSPGQRAYVFLYILANFFQNFGPNTTTFILPGEAFPTRYRSTAHGISAACGKSGAIISQIIFTFAVDAGSQSDTSPWVGYM